MIRRPAVIALLWAKNARVLNDLARISNADIYSLRLPEYGAPPEARYLEEMLDERGDEGRRDAARELAARIQAGVEGMARDDRLAPLDRNIACQAFSEGLAQRIEQSMALIDMCDNLAKRSEVSLIVVNEDGTPIPRTLCLWARARGIRSTHLSHSLNLYREIMPDELYTDTMVVFGPRGRSHYYWLGFENEHMPSLGNPHWDDYALDFIPNRDRWRHRLADRFGYNPSRPVVLFGTTWMPSEWACEEPDEYERTLRAFLRAARRLRERVPSTFVVRDRIADPVMARRCIAEEGFSDGEVIYTTDDVRPWIACADVVVSCGSNLSIEAAICGAAAIDLWTAESWLNGPPFPGGEGVLSALPGELADAMERVLSDDAERARLRTAATANVGEYCSVLDGTSTRRVAEYFASLL